MIEKQPRIQHQSIADSFAEDVLIGLSQPEKRLSSRFFYDDEGSRLFRMITETREYYPTLCERQIIEKHGRHIIESVTDHIENHRIAAHHSTANKPVNLIELGAGDGHKTVPLIRELQRLGHPFTYIPVDISEEALGVLSLYLRENMPEIPLHGLVAEYFDALEYIRRQDNAVNVVLFLGSNIGNFHLSEQHRFFLRLWEVLNDGDFLLTGFDLVKDPKVLLRAYDDADGVTARFNLNLLERINHELNGEIDTRNFIHFPAYNPVRRAMESYLIHNVDGEKSYAIRRLHRTFTFGPYEPISTEFSYKYCESSIRAMAEKTGYYILHNYIDDRRFFIDSLWQVCKSM